MSSTFKAIFNEKSRLDGSSSPMKLNEIIIRNSLFDTVFFRFPSKLWLDSMRRVKHISLVVTRTFHSKHLLRLFNFWNRLYTRTNKICSMVEKLLFSTPPQSPLRNVIQFEVFIWLLYRYYKELLNWFDCLESYCSMSSNELC